MYTKGKMFLEEEPWNGDEVYEYPSNRDDFWFENHDNNWRWEEKEFDHNLLKPAKRRQFDSHSLMRSGRFDITKNRHTYRSKYFWAPIYEEAERHWKYHTKFVRYDTHAKNRIFNKIKMEQTGDELVD